MSSGPAHGSSTCGRTAPDLRVIKQVEQVTRWLWKDQPGRFVRIRSIGTTGAVEVLVFLISNVSLARAYPVDAQAQQRNRSVG